MLVVGPGFFVRPVPVGFMVDKAALGQVVVLRGSPVNVIIPTPLTDKQAKSLQRRNKSFCGNWRALVREVRLLAQWCFIALDILKIGPFVLFQDISRLVHFFFISKEGIKITELARRCQIAGMYCVGEASHFTAVCLSICRYSSPSFAYS